MKQTLLASILVIFFLRMAQASNAYGSTLMTSGVLNKAVAINDVSTQSSSYCRLDSVMIEETLINIGNQDANGNMSLFIYDPLGRIAFSLELNDIFISMDNEKIYNLTYQIPQSSILGVYTVSSLFFYENSTSAKNATFNVISCCGDGICDQGEQNCGLDCGIPPPPQGGSVGMPSGPKIALSEEEKPSIDIEYENYIIISRGENRTFLIKVKNNGTADIHNLTLEAEHDKIILVPLTSMSRPLLKPGSSEIFMYEIKAPENASLGIYDAQLKISSKEIKAIKDFKINVTENALKSRIAELLDYYSKSLNSLYESATATENATDAVAFLEKAKEELNQARNLFDLGLYKESEGKIQEAKVNIINAALLLEKKSYRPAKSNIDLKPFIFAAVGLAALSFAFIVARLLLKRRKRYYGFFE